ncbi:hypothetical protein BHE16_05030 [Neomicrococcus aestuarii]|uniref:Uncharacterized protein n=1 Tax=Neomicrococcus aestuarii TaxID=556325 RepID=A0A1L2ZMX6_9MICC|nr:hypothetical protein BHE16_05030 [Neomicrococcus aestuarii]
MRVVVDDRIRQRLGCRRVVPVPTFPVICNRAPGPINKGNAATVLSCAVVLLLLPQDAKVLRNVSGWGLCVGLLILHPTRLATLSH